MWLENFPWTFASVPFIPEGVIRAVRPQQMTVWIDPEKYPWNVENGRLVFTGKFSAAPCTCGWRWMQRPARRPWGTEDLYFCTETQKVETPAAKGGGGETWCRSR